MLQRRNLLKLIGGATFAWSPAAHAQTMPVIGYLNSGSPHLAAARLRAFLQGLDDAGYVEGRNVAIEFRWAEGQNDRLPDMAADLVRRQVSIIVATGGVPSALAAKAATTTIPVVFQVGADPVAIGLVASLSRPGGNVTGGTTLNVEVGPKRLELDARTHSHRIPHRASRQSGQSDQCRDDIERISMAAARALGLESACPASERCCGSSTRCSHGSAKLRAGALVVGTDTLFNNRSAQLGLLALRHAVPAIYQFREFTAVVASRATAAALPIVCQAGLLHRRDFQRRKNRPTCQCNKSTKIELILNLSRQGAWGHRSPAHSSAAPTR